MRRFLVILASATLVCGCEKAAQRLGQAADATRAATEHAETASEASSNAREARVFADARNLEQDQEAHRLAEAGEVERYEVRRDVGGWKIFDNKTGAVARAGVKSETGLSEREAYQAYESLKQADEEANSAFDVLNPNRPAHN